MRRRSRGKDKGGGGKVLGWKGEGEEVNGSKTGVRVGEQKSEVEVGGEWRSKKKGRGWWRHRCIISSLTLLLNILPV